MRAARDVLAQIGDDCRNNRNLASRGVLATYRFGHALHGGRRAPLTSLGRVLYRIVYVLVCIPQGCELDPRAVIGPGLILPHGGNGIVISAHAVIGADVTLYHQVTIGNNDHLKANFGAPVLGDGVVVYPGAKLIGPISLGPRSRVGANSVVVHSVAEGVTVAGVPARVLGS